METIIKNLKPKKSPGQDKITNKHIKLGGDKLVRTITELFNKILGSAIPNKWRFSDIIILHKKGNRHKIENYRPITLSLTVAKIFSKLIERRLQPILARHKPIEQAGFRSSFSTIDPYIL